MQHHDHHRHSIYKRKKKSKERSIPEMIRSLHCIDGMDIRFPWKTRHKKFIDFVLSVPGLLIQLDHNNKHQVSIDYRANVAPFLNTIHRLPLNDCIRKHLLSNEVRKNKKYKFMKRHTNMYKNELEICRLLQNIHFNVDCPANTNKCDKLFIVNLRTMYSINLDQMLKSIQRNATVRFPRVSALQLLLYFESQNDILNDLNVSFYEQNHVSRDASQSFNNIDWTNIPLVIQQKWLLNKSKKTANDALKAVQWKQYQIETFYQILCIVFNCQTSDQSLTIVDWGSGAGNVGLCIAYLFPMHTIICVEIEASRVALARDRAQQAGITNVKFVCDAMENVDIAFDIGIAVHCCGILTDYVQMQCFKHNASFILCSCCNGKCYNQKQSSTAILDLVQFPRSQSLRNAIQKENSDGDVFNKLTSFSDFNFDRKLFEGNQIDKEKYLNYCRYSIKRKFCKIICEMDRCLKALEIESDAYSRVILTQIHPNDRLFESSPKADVIIGIHSRHCTKQLELKTVFTQSK